MKILGVALAYALAGKAGLSLAYVNASATAVWPPAGIALAAFLLFGYRIWPGVLLGAFIINAATAGTLTTSAVIAIGNTLEGALGTFLIIRFAEGQKVFDHPYDILKFAVFALGCAVVAATVGVTTLAVSGFASWAGYRPIWLTWWLGDATAMVLMTPLLVLWNRDAGPRWDRRKVAEAGAVALFLAFVAMGVFGGLLPAAAAHYSLEFLCTPITVWAAFRLGQREAASASFLLALAAIWGTLQGFGPFSTNSPNGSLLMLQAYMGYLSIMSLSVAAVVAERRRAKDYLEEQIQKRTEYLKQSLNVLQEEIDERENTQRLLRASENRFRRLMESDIIGIITIDENGRLWETNDAFLKMIGYGWDDLEKGMLNVHTLTPPEYQAQEAWAKEQLQARGICPTLEKEFIHRDGRHISVLLGGVILDQIPQRIVYFVVDATSRRQAMEALRRAYDEIETRVQDRTVELAQSNEELAREIVRRKKAETELRDLSLLDPLTGLYNRRGFLAMAEQQWLQAHRDKRALLLFFADIDGLKHVNDTLGHARGDQAIAESADALRSTFRKSDVLARIGGDEFAVVATEGPLEHDRTYLDRLQMHIDQLNAAGPRPFKLSLSIGVAQFDQKQTTSVAELMRRADRDLYQRKHSRATS